MTDKQHPEEHPVNDIGDDHVLAHDVDEEPVEANRRLFEGGMLKFVTLLAIAYSSFHLYSLNIAPLETWSFRIVHIAGPWCWASSCLPVPVLSPPKTVPHAIAGQHGLVPWLWCRPYTRCTRHFHSTR